MFLTILKQTPETKKEVCKNNICEIKCTFAFSLLKTKYITLHIINAQAYLHFK